MTDEMANLIFEHLRRLRSDAGEVNADLSGLKERTGDLEQQSATMFVRLDRVDSRLDGIERRLDLVEV